MHEREGSRQRRELRRCVQTSSEGVTRSQGGSTSTGRLFFFSFGSCGLKFFLGRLIPQELKPKKNKATSVVGTVFCVFPPFLGFFTPTNLDEQKVIRFFIIQRQ